MVAVLAILGIACAGFGAQTVDPAVQPLPTPEGFVGVPDGDGGLQAVADGTARNPEPGLLPGPGTWMIRSTTPNLDVWDGPGPDATVRFALETTNPWGQAIAFPVEQARAIDGEAWYRIMLGIEPNGARGWVRASDVSLGKATDRIVVDRSTRTLQHFRNGRLRHRFSVGIGMSSSPTTLGEFFVWARLQPSDTTGPYGTYLLGLSGFSEVMTDWPGGGRMAIHGTTDPADRGREVSFGCVRVYNDQMHQLRNVPMGTTVLIKE